MPTTVQVKEITPQAYGAHGDGVNNDTTAVQAALAAAEANGQNLFFPTGTYLLSPGLQVDLSQLQNPAYPYGSTTTGITIYGEGQNSVLNFSSNPPSAVPGLYIADFTSTTSKAYAYFHVRDLQITGSTTQYVPLVQLGNFSQLESLSHGNFTNLTISNVVPPGYTGGEVGFALNVNNVANSVFSGTFSSQGLAGLVLTQSQYCLYMVSCSATGANGAALNLADWGRGAPYGANVANVFLSPELQNSLAALYIEASRSVGNVFVAPYLNVTGSGSTAVQAAGGFGNRLIQPYFSGNAIISPAIGITVQGS